jgi:hypothetical protein
MKKEMKWTDQMNDIFIDLCTIKLNGDKFSPSMEDLWKICKELIKKKNNLKNLKMSDGYRLTEDDLLHINNHVGSGVLLNNPRQSWDTEIPPMDSDI